MGLGVGFVVAFGLAALTGIAAHTNPTEMDTVPYLRNAYEIRQTGGVLNHIPNLVRGVYKEATQHPLYHVVLSPWAKRSFSFFVTAKFVTAFLALALFGVFFLITRQFFGLQTALASSCLLLFSATFIHLSTMVACETLFSLFFILFIAFSALGVEKSVYWYAAGASAGFAFLTKSLGILCIGIFILSSLWIHRKSLKTLFLNPAFWGFFILFVLVALPLFLRNVKVYGSPLFSESRGVLWIDRWHEYMRPDVFANPPTLAQYWKKHGPGGFIKIFSEGIFVRNPKMICDGLKPFLFWAHPVDLTKLTGFHQVTAAWQGAWALFLVVAAGFMAWRRRREPVTVFASTAFFIFFIFVGWYSKIFPGEPPTRLLYPVLFFVVWFASHWLSKISLKIVALMSGIFLCGYIAALTMNGPWKNMDLRHSYRVNPIAAVQLEWLVRYASADKRVLLGFDATAYTFYIPSLKNEVISAPTLESMDAFLLFLKKNELRHVAIDLTSVIYNRGVFGEYFSLSRAGMMPKKPLPSSLKEMSVDISMPPLVRFYEVVG